MKFLTSPVGPKTKRPTPLDRENHQVVAEKSFYIESDFSGQKQLFELNPIHSIGRYYVVLQVKVYPLDMFATIWNEMEK